MRMWAPLGRNSNSSHEAANCGYARTTTTGCPTDIAATLKSILQSLGQDIYKRTTF